MRSTALRDNASAGEAVPDDPTLSALSEACIARVASGDPAALAEVFARFSTDVYRIAFAITLSPDEADDVVQDVFIGLPEALHAYHERGRFGAWLGMVAARTALMRRRRMHRLTDLPAHAHDDRDASQELVDRLALERALAMLPDDMRTVFVLKAIEGYSHDEIAHHLGIRRGTAEVRLFRAIRRLRTLLGAD